MAWNRPNQDQELAKAKQPAGLRSRSLVRGGIAAGIVVLGAIAAWVFLSPSDAGREKEQERTKGRIKEVSPSIAKKEEPKPVVKPAETSKVEVAKKEPEDLGYYTNKLGQVKKRTGKGVVVHGPPSKTLFKNRAEVIINAIFSTKVGEVSYVDIPPNFQKLFEQSLLEKIEFADDDTPEERAQKEQVIALKKELRKRWMAGEDVAEIMREEQRNMQKKSQQYQFYADELREIRHSGASDEEIAEFAAAARKAMKENGIEKGLIIKPKERKILKQIEKEINE